MFVLRLRLYGRGGLAFEPTDVAILRHVVSKLSGVGEIQILEDVRDVDLTCAVECDSALEAHTALLTGLNAAFGRAASSRNITTLKVSILEV